MGSCLSGRVPDDIVSVPHISNCPCLSSAADVAMLADTRAIGLVQGTCAQCDGDAYPITRALSIPGITVWLYVSFFL